MTTVHMMFLSWRGEPIGQKPRELKRELDLSLRSLHQTGVPHNDVREANALWCEEMRRMIVMNFERATIADRYRRPLDPIVPIKRPWAVVGPAQQRDT